MLENARQAEAMEYTVSGRVGKFLEPAFRPIGFDWKLTTASIGALAAKEVFVSQLGILYAEGEADEESVPLREQLVKHYTPLQGFCIMIFCLLSIPCLATLAVIRRELNSWKMAAFEAVCLLLLAYVVTLVVYQSGLLFQIGTKLLG
ncbi:Fe(2+) transporter FeoB [bioreactor metagenome]|uniref:Fe(2+) transporter FeoB n=1 Tax=bioreactor metagenome TaxID=1076179 RepID=A0A645ADZ5_9ZZZZ